MPTPPSRPAVTVAVPRGLLVAVAAGLVAALVAIAFLLGRESGRSADVARVSAEVETASEAPPAPSAGPAGTTPRVAPPPPTPAAPAMSPSASTSTPAPRGAAPVPRPAPDTRTRDAVARYFEQVDELGGDGMSMGNPDDFAMMIVSESASGNFSAFDQMLSDQRANLRRLQRMSVPRELREYHAQTIELTQSGIRLLENVRRGLESGDMTRLMALSSSAQTMQADAEKAERLATELKRKYDLGP